MLTEDAHGARVTGPVLGLDERDLAALTGYTTPAMQAIAALRDAWLHADTFNKQSVQMAITWLATSFRYPMSRAIALKVLLHGVEELLAPELEAVFNNEPRTVVADGS